jgi:hypothetical protein
VDHRGSSACAGDLCRPAGRTAGFDWHVLTMRLNFVRERRAGSSRSLSSPPSSSACSPGGIRFPLLSHDTGGYVLLLKKSAT